MGGGAGKATPEPPSSRARSAIHHSLPLSCTKLGLRASPGREGLWAHAAGAGAVGRAHRRRRRGQSAGRAHGAHDTRARRRLKGRRAAS